MLMEKYDISIVAIQEHRRVHDEEVKQEKFGRYLLVTSSAWRNNSNGVVGGVGFILNQKAASVLPRFLAGFLIPLFLAGGGEKIATFSNCINFSKNEAIVNIF